MLDAKNVVKLERQTEKVKSWCKDNGYIHIVTFPIGSWNYNLADELSDLDSRSIVVPTFQTEITRPVIEATTIIDEETKEHCSIWEARAAKKTFLKQCITATEALFAIDYRYSNPKLKDYWQELRFYREDICHYSMREFLITSFGYMESMSQKYLKTGGGKHLMHMYRAKNMIEKIMLGSTFAEAFDMTSEREDLLCLKHCETNDAVHQMLVDWKNAKSTNLLRLFSNESNQSIENKINGILCQLYNTAWNKE